MPGLVKGEEGVLGGNNDKFENYDTLTIGEIMALAVQGENTRRKLVRKEEAGKNRPELVAILRVNWNS